MILELFEGGELSTRTGEGGSGISLFERDRRIRTFPAFNKRFCFEKGRCLTNIDNCGRTI